MKYLLLIVMIVSTIEAKYIGDFSGYADLTYNMYKKEKFKNTNVDKPDNTKYRVDVLLNYDYKINNFKFTYSQGYLHAPSSYNTIYTTEIEPVEMYYINELSISQQFDNGLGYSVGMIPFKYGSFYEYSSFGEARGNGLMLASSYVLNAAFLFYKYGDFTVIYGMGVRDKYINAEHNLNTNSYPTVRTKTRGINVRGSEGDFGIIKYAHGKHKVEFNHFDMDVVSSGVSIGNAVLHGIGYSYDDSLHSGNILYGIFMHSDTHLLVKGFNGVKFTYTPDAETGYQYLLGWKYYYDSNILNRTVFTNVEYIKTSNGYNNFIVGSPIARYASSDIGDVYNVSAGVEINKNVNLTVRYLGYRSDGYVVKLGSLNTPTPEKDKSLQKRDVVSLELLLKF